MKKEVYDRITEEYKQLSEKIEKLSDFLQNLKEGDINPLNYDLLVAQANAMNTYRGILAIRLGINKPESDEV